MWRKRIGNTLVAIITIVFAPILAVVVYFVVAVICSVIPVKQVCCPQANDSIKIFISSNGFHTDIVLPMENETWDWTRYIDTSLTETDCSNMVYVAFGWGDSTLYTTTLYFKDLKAVTAFNAAFSSEASVLHTEFFSSYYEDEGTIAVYLSRFQYQRLANFIHNSFMMQADGTYCIIPGVSYRSYDLFYRSKRHYGLLYTSNTWVNDGLRICGAPASLWTPFAQGITYHYPNPIQDVETTEEIEQD